MKWEVKRLRDKYKQIKRDTRLGIYDNYIAISMMVLMTYVAVAVSTLLFKG